MAFTIPDRAITYPFQSRWFESDVAIIGRSAGGHTGVLVGGCEGSESTIPDGNTQVSAGQVVLDGDPITVAQQTVGHDVADALLPRFDLVVAYDDGICAALPGTADAAPLPPLPDDDSVALYQVFIPANDTAIEDEQIVDKRVFVPSPLEASPWIAASCTADLIRTSNASFTADPILQLPVTAGGTYRIKLAAWFSCVAVSGPQTPNLKTQWAGPVPTRATGAWGYAAASVGQLQLTFFTAAMFNAQFSPGTISIAQGAEAYTEARFMYVPSTTGILSFSWGQQIASLNQMVRRKGSLLEYEIV